MKGLLVALIILNFCILPVKADELSFNDFLSTALNNSYKLKISQLDSKVAQKGVKEARAGYYPTLSGFATTERYNDLTNGNSQITAVGNEILLNRSYYQDMAAVGLSYNVFDFGVRRKQLDIAKADDKQKSYLLQKDTRDLKLDAVDIYSDALSLYKQSKIKTETLALQTELVDINKRLRKNSLSKKLSEISYYTNKDYDLNSLKLSDFPSDLSTIPVDADGLVKLSAEVMTFLPEKSFEAKVYDLEVLKKQKEYEIQKKINFPKIRFDTRYNFYGSDPSNFFGGIGDLSQRSITLRLSTSFTLFDGFKNINTVSKKKMEVEKAKIERDKQIAELKKKYEQIQLDCKNAIIQTENNIETLKLVDKNLENLRRLNTNGVVARSECIKKQLDLLDKKLKLEQNQIKNFVAQYKLKTLSEEEKGL